MQQQVFKHKKGFVAANLSGVRLAEWVRVHFSQYIQEEVSSALELLSSVFEFFPSVLKLFSSALQCAQTLSPVCSHFSYILKEAHCPVCWSCTVCSDKLGKTANKNTEDEYKDNSSAQAVQRTVSVSAFTVVARCHMDLFRDKSIWITPGIVGVAYKERKLCVSE